MTGAFSTFRFIVETHILTTCYEFTITELKVLLAQNLNQEPNSAS